jgi:hypothetical protein
MDVIFFFSFQPSVRPFRSKMRSLFLFRCKCVRLAADRAKQTPRGCSHISSFVTLGLHAILLWAFYCLTSYGGRRKNRNIGGMVYTIKRAAVVNDSAPESCADCVFGAFFGGSTSHQRVFFMAVFI